MIRPNRFSHRFLALFITAALALWIAPSETQAAGVFFGKKLGLDASQYRVTGAAGKNESSALQEARNAALFFAADSLSGDAREKVSIKDYIEHNADELMKLTKAGRITRRTFAPDGEKLMVDVRVDVQTKQLRLTLESERVIKASSDLSRKVGNPTILVVSSELQNNPKVRKLTQLGHTATDLLTSFFTDRQWNVVDRKAVDDARKRQAAMENLSGLGEDPIAQVAQLVGADIYVVFSMAYAQSGVQGSLSVKAYDTATGSVLASVMKPSKQYLKGTPYEKVIREAAGNAMPSFFDQVRNYWMAEIKKGRKYKIVVRGDFSNRQRYRAVRDAIKDLGDFDKTVKTKETLAGILISTEDEDDIADDLIDGIQDAGFSKVEYVVEQRGLFILEAQ